MLFFTDELLPFFFYSVVSFLDEDFLTEVDLALGVDFLMGEDFLEDLIGLVGLSFSSIIGSFSTSSLSDFFSSC